MVATHVQKVRDLRFKFQCRKDFFLNINLFQLCKTAIFHTNVIMKHITLLQEIYRNGTALLPELFYSLFFNTLWYMITGNRFTPEEHGKLRYFARQALRFVRSVDVSGDAVALTPWLRHFAPKLTGFTDLMESTINMLKYMEVRGRITQGTTIIIMGYDVPNQNT